MFRIPTKVKAKLMDNFSVAMSVEEELSSEAFGKIRELFAKSSDDLNGNFDSKLFTNISIDPGECKFESYINFNNPLNPRANCPNPIDEKLEKLIEKSVINDSSFYKPTTEEPLKSKRALRRFKQEIRERTAGKNWFHMKSSELTDEDLIDRELLGMRDVVYSSRFYKKGSLKKSNFSKYVQVGTWQKSPLDFYSDRREAKGSRKKSLVENLMADAQFKKTNREKYLKVMRKSNSFRRLEAKHNKKLLKERRTGKQ